MNQKEEIKEFLRKEYGIKDLKIKPLPKKEDGEYYLVFSENKTYILKIFFNNKIFSKSKRELEIIHNFTYSLRKEYDFTNSPFKNTHNKVLSVFHGRVFILYEWIKGDNSREIDYKELGKIISKIHKLPKPYFKNIKEDLELINEKKVFEVLKELERSSFKKGSPGYELKEMFILNKELIFKIFNYVEKELSYIKSKRKEYVLSHGDLHKGNILVNKGKFYIIDWEHLKLGLPERDFMWFREKDEVNKYFLNSYKKSIKVDKRALNFYILKKGLAEFVFFSKSILSSEYGEREDNKKIKFMKAQMKIFEKILINNLEN